MAATSTGTGSRYALITMACIYHQRQGGAALLILLIIVIMGAMGLFLYTAELQDPTVKRDDATRDALVEAKAALIGWSTHFPYSPAGSGRFGFLPCPDIDGENEGHSKGNCGNQDANAIGRFPWSDGASISTGPLRDGNGECLWYAVSGHYKNGNPRTDMLNEDINGLFSVYAQDGSTLLHGPNPADRVVAVIISPGKILDGQDRTDVVDPLINVDVCGGNYDPTNYLECLDLDDPNNPKLCSVATVNGIDNAAIFIEDQNPVPSGVLANAEHSFVSAQNNQTAINDRIITITRSELWAVARKRTEFANKLADMTAAAAQCLADYGDDSPTGNDWGRLPWPAPVDLDLPNEFDPDIYNADASYKGAKPGDIDDDPLYFPKSRLGRLPDLINDDDKEDFGDGPLLTDGCLSVENLELWQNWKDHLFYVLAKNHDPKKTEPAKVCSSDDDKCPSLDTDEPYYAAIVFFAGQRLALLGQERYPLPPRPSPADKPNMKLYAQSIIGRYLDDDNGGDNFPDKNGKKTYVAGTAAPPFNDIVFCIDLDMKVLGPDPNIPGSNCAIEVFP